MRYVILNILCGQVFLQTLRYAQRRGAVDYLAGAVNYVFSAAVSISFLAAMAWFRSMPPLWPAAPLGAACGAAYFIQFLLIVAAYRLAGVGITTAVGSMGILVPILLSWRIWGEPMTPWRWVAVALLPPAMFLIRPLRRHLADLSWKADAVLLAALLNSGLMSTLHKAVNVAVPPVAGQEFLFFQPSQLVYQSSLFLVSAACSVAYACRRRGRCGPAELTLGSVIGASNVLVTIFALVGVGQIGAVVFFPTVTSAGIALAVLLSWALWKERVTPRQLAGLSAAIAIVILVNLGGIPKSVR